MQAIKEGFYADTISTDLHVGSMNAGMKDMVNVMSKFLALGMPLKDVILKSTWKPAQVIKLEQFGHLSVGAGADVAVLRLEKGKFGFQDQRAGRMDGTQRLGCELTLRDGAVVWDLNGLAGEPWESSRRQRPGRDPPAPSRWTPTRADKEKACRARNTDPAGLLRFAPATGRATWPAAARSAPGSGDAERCTGAASP